MSRKTIGVIGAMESEICHLKAKMESPVAEFYAGLTFYRGKMGKNDIVLVQSGIGKVNAARTAQALIDRYAPDYLINTGIGGGIGDGLHVGDLVIGTELVQHDFSLSLFGYAKGYIPGFGDGKTPTFFRADPGLVRAFSESAQAFLPNGSIRQGRIASGDIFVADAEIKGEINREFSADAVEMEGAAIAQAAVLNNIPFVVVRAVSDLADGSATESFERFEEETAVLSAKIVELCVSKLS